MGNDHQLGLISRLTDPRFRGLLIGTFLGGLIPFLATGGMVLTVPFVPPFSLRVVFDYSQDLSLVAGIALGIIVGGIVMQAEIRTIIQVGVGAIIAIIVLVISPGLLLGWVYQRAMTLWDYSVFNQVLVLNELAQLSSLDLRDFITFMFLYGNEIFFVTLIAQTVTFVGLLLIIFCLGRYNHRHAIQ